jgi:predicted metalloprotease
MTNIDSSKKVYLFLHGRMDLHEKTLNVLASNGFQKENLVMADPKQAGEVGDYMAMLWMPPNPDHIKIQQITAVEDCEPEGMIGVWKGVAKDDLFEIKLE